MNEYTSQVTSVSTDQAKKRKHQTPALFFYGGIGRWLVDSPKQRIINAESVLYHNMILLFFAVGYFFQGVFQVLWVVVLVTFDAVD